MDIIDYKNFKSNDVDMSIIEKELSHQDDLILQAKLSKFFLKLYAKDPIAFLNYFDNKILIKLGVREHFTDEDFTAFCLTVAEDIAMKIFYYKIIDGKFCYINEYDSKIIKEIEKHFNEKLF